MVSKFLRCLFAPGVQLQVFGIPVSEEVDLESQMVTYRCRDIELMISKLMFEESKDPDRLMEDILTQIANALREPSYPANISTQKLLVMQSQAPLAEPKAPPSPWKPKDAPMPGEVRLIRFKQKH
jgi:hypothetical protein